MKKKSSRYGPSTLSERLVPILLILLAAGLATVLFLVLLSVLGVI